MKKQLFELKMNEGIDVGDLINKFNKCVTQLLSVKIKINKKKKSNYYFIGISTKIIWGNNDYALNWEDNVDIGWEVDGSFRNWKYYSSQVVCLILGKLLW